MDEKIVLDKKEKKAVRKLVGFIVIPFIMIMIHNAFVGLYLSIFGNSLAYGGLKNYPVYNLIAKQSFTLIFMIILIYLWAAPMIKFLKNPTVKLRDKLRKKIKNRYRDMGLFFLMSLVATAFFCFLRSDITNELFIKEVLPALIFAFFAQVGIALSYVDYLLYEMPEFMNILYKDEELFEPKTAFSVPVYLKITLLVLVCAIIPSVLIYIGTYWMQLSFEIHVNMFQRLFFICMVMLLTGLGFIFNGLQKPLDALIKKMHRVSKGDYDVKTKIYFSDEISKLKLGFNEMLDGLKEREEIKGTFGRYMSIEIARELLKSGKVNLGGEEIQAAVMFCDIRNFTPLSEKLTPPDVVAFLNDYFSYITPPITANNGVISKFIGDAVMVIYTPALGSTDYASDALRSAIGMRKALAEFNAASKVPANVLFGIGIQTGNLVAGNVGTTARLEYTFIGDTVNIASRLESKTKELGTDILITKSVMDEVGKECGDFNFESVGHVQLKGKSKPLELYKVV